MQPFVALPREEEIQAILGHLPFRNQCSCQDLLSVPRRLGDLYVERIEVAVTHDPYLGDGIQGFADDLKEG